MKISLTDKQKLIFYKKAHEEIKNSRLQSNSICLLLHRYYLKKKSISLSSLTNSDFKRLMPEIFIRATIPFNNSHKYNSWFNNDIERLCVLQKSIEELEIRLKNKKK
jgi:hypothetical protein